MATVLIILIAAALAAVLTARFCQPQSSMYILDFPNRRSLHHNAKPRTGGVAIFLAIYLSAALASWWLCPNLPVARLALAGILVGGISFIDDCFHVTAVLRLTIHFTAVGLAVTGFEALPTLELPGLSLSWAPQLAYALVILSITWLLNLYNFMDGMDGLAAGMTVIGVATMAYLGWISGHHDFTVFCLIVAAASFGFWCFNFPPSAIFMGDVGACSLGFFVGILSLWGCHSGVFGPWIPFLILSPFIVDATITLILRLLRRERVWMADRNHFYHKLLLRIGHKNALRWEYLLMFACSVSAIAVYQEPAWVQQLTLAAWFGTYTVLALTVTGFAKRRDVLDRLS